MSEKKEKLRIDKYLWSIRLFKTGLLPPKPAKRQSEANGTSVKAAKTVNMGDEYEVKTEARKWIIKVRGCSITGCTTAKPFSYYIDLTPPKKWKLPIFAACLFPYRQAAKQNRQTYQKRKTRTGRLHGELRRMRIDIIRYYPNCWKVLLAIAS